MDTPDYSHQATISALHAEIDGKDKVIAEYQKQVQTLNDRATANYSALSDLQYAIKYFLRHTAKMIILSLILTKQMRFSQKMVWILSSVSIVFSSVSKALSLSKQKTKMKQIQLLMILMFHIGLAKSNPTKQKQLVQIHNSSFSVGEKVLSKTKNCSPKPGALYVRFTIQALRQI